MLKVVRTSEVTNKKGPRKWVPKDKIIYVADILDRSTETPIMVSGQWMFATHDRKKAYIPRAGGEVGFSGNEKGKIVGSGTIGIDNSPCIDNVLLVVKVRKTLERGGLNRVFESRVNF